MKEIIIDDAKLVKLVKEKEQLVYDGRAVSIELEQIETELEELKKQEREYTEAYKNEELLNQGIAIQEEINAKIEELNKIAEKLKKEKLGNIPKDVVDAHIEKAKRKEKLERELNKIGLKIERIKTRYIPKIQKLARPQLENEFDDLESSELRDDKIVVKVFNHIDIYKEQFRKRKNGS